MLLVVLLAAIWLTTGSSSQIDFSLQSLIPHVSDFSHLAFFTAILFSLMGIEMSAVHANEVKDPQRSYPRALTFSALIIISSLIMSSLAIAIVIPQKDLGLVTGLMQAFTKLLEVHHLSLVIPMMALLIIIGGTGSVAAWIVGPTKGLLIAAQDKTLPESFARTNKKGVPVAILIAQAILVTFLSLLFLLMPTVSSSYWILGNMSAQLGLLFYIILFATAIRLRMTKADVPRRFKIPGGLPGVWFVGTVGILTCLSALVIGFVPPAQIDVGSTRNYELILAGGMLAFCIIPIICYQIYHHRRS